jgi:hypothetical protein
MKLKKQAFLFTAISGVLTTVMTARASVSVASSEEAMVLSGSPNTSWDPKGAVEISGNGLNTAYSGNSEYAFMYFNTSAAVTSFDAQYGTGDWTLTGASVQLAANFATSGVYPNNNVFNEIEPGSFTLSYISNNGWLNSSSGGVTWNNKGNYLPGVGNNLEEALGTFSYAANGSSPFIWTLSPTSDFISSIDSGATSLYGTPADTSVGYLSNTITQGNPAVLILTAQPTAVPEPVLLSLLAMSGPALLSRRRRRA